MTDRKKPGWKFWASVVLAVVLVAYPLSFGPACWIASRSFPQNHHAFRMVYRPIGNFAYWRVPVLPSLVMDYARLWLPKGGTVVIPGGPNADGTEIAIRRD